VADDATQLIVEHLDISKHDRQSFDSGSEALNTFLQTQARKEMERRSAVTYVLVDLANPSEIIGYYSLSSATVLLDSVPSELAAKLGRQPSVPTTLMGRLAIATKYQRNGLGSKLLWDALNRSEEKSRDIGSVAVIVDAKDEKAGRFYEKFGFRRFVDPPLRLYLMMATIAAASK
jgi:ribosomal protein S18 acetylase RimI-like enzyme